MKRIRHLVVACLSFIAISTNLTAQFTIGADNGANTATSYPTPISDYFKTMKSQYLYLASEMTAAGMTSGFIDEISWNVIGVPAGTGTTENYTIKLLATNTSSLGITTWETGAALVWGPADYIPTVGTNTFNLDYPYYWDGVSNIIIEICGGDPAADYTKNARVTWTGPLAFNGSRTYANDGEADICGYEGGEFYDATPGGYDYRPRVTFGTSPAINCSELPIIGATNTTDIAVCADFPFTLSIGAVAELGIIYSWSTSPNGISWTNIPGANDAALTTTQNNAAYYRCTVACLFSGDNSNSVPVFIDMKDPGECYCAPTYVLGSTSGDYISNVELGDISNATGPTVSPYYIYYDALSTDLTTGETYTLSLTVGEYETNNGIAAWIDFNRDGDFDASEKLGESTGLTAFATVDYTFITPAWAIPGVARMRIRDVYNTVGILPCGSYEYGEAEDYNVNIIAGIPPVAIFTYSGEPTVEFTDLSTGEPTEWHWDFDDATSSTEQNPVHTYTTNGTYNVCLTATGYLGSNTSCQNVVIDYYATPVADFSYTGDPSVTFTDLSANEPTSWNWSFGDVATSTEQNPTHTYATDGSYFVCLTAINVIGSNTVCKFVDVTGYPEVPEAAFSYTGNPDVAFTDLSTNTPTAWEWNFDDGFTSSEQNPSHTFTSNGTYNVCLTASNGAGGDVVCQNIVIDAYAAPAAGFAFTGDPIVDFTDLSTNTPITWLWNFDDGDVSTEQNPTHNFVLNGTYNVCLSVTAAGGSDTYCQDVIIAANAIAPIADFEFSITGMTVAFSDLSSNNPDEWYWDFGDGFISGLQNPSHTYVNKEIYNVCLKATNDIGFDQTCKTIDLSTGIELQEIIAINLYPNPAATSVTLSLPQNIDEPVVTVYNAVGQEIQISFNTYNANTLVLDIQNLPAGTYVILVHNSSIFGTVNFVKQ
ncbi:MAG: PKD domain-containing protein [Chitinophagales bacterium]